MDLRHPDESPQNPPWLFGLLSIPYGLSNAIITILMPFVLRKNGVAVDRIADVVAIAMIPAVWFFLYSPVVDLGLRRRNWILFTAVGAGVFAGAATWLVSSSLLVVTTLLFLASAVSGLMSTANGSLLTRLIPSARGRAGGWYNAGNLGGGAVGGGLAIWLADRLTVPMLGVAVIAMMAAPALAALMIKEHAPESRPLGPLFADLFRDLWDVVRSWRTLVGLVFFLSPVGSGGIANLISGIGPEYHASTNEVLWVTGVASGLLCALGSLVGGFACDRINRMKAYALSGAFSAAFGLYLGFGPQNAWTYGAGYSGYSIAVGFAYAVFTALVLEVLGPRRHAAGTSYSLLVASGNVPLVYMTWLDGLGFKQAGARGLASVDALANGAFAVLLFLLAIYARRFWNKAEEPLPAHASTP